MKSFSRKTVENSDWTLGNTCFSSGNENKGGQGSERRDQRHTKKPTAKKALEGAGQQQSGPECWWRRLCSGLLSLYQVLGAALPCMHILCHLHSLLYELLTLRLVLPYFSASPGGIQPQLSTAAMCLIMQPWDFPGGPASKTPRFPCRGPRFNPQSGNQIPHATSKSLHAITKTRHSQIKK